MTASMAAAGIPAINKGPFTMSTRKSDTTEPSSRTCAADNQQLELRRRERYLDVAAKITLARQIVLPRGAEGEASGSTEAMTHVADALREAAHIWHDMKDDERHRAAYGLCEVLARLGHALDKYRQRSPG